MILKLILVSVLLSTLEGAVKENYGEKIKNNDVSVGDYFGSAVAINNKYILIASGRDDVDGKEEVGSVNVHKNEDGYPQLKKLYPKGRKGLGFFGSSVALNDKFIVVGSKWADGINTDQGAVYVYKTTGKTWSSEKLVASDGKESDRFGHSVDINDQNEIIVGATYSGAAYVFAYEGNRWVQKQKLVPSDISDRAKLGTSVSITNEYIAIGAPGHGSSPETYYTGAVSIYRKNSSGKWIKETMITSPNAEKSGKFGHSVSMHDKYLVISAPDENGATGNAYVFGTDGKTWKLINMLKVHDRKDHFLFGISVSIHKTQLVVGFQYDEDKKIKKRSIAYVFDLSGGKWLESQRLTPKDSKNEDNIYAVAIFDGTVVAGCESNRRRSSSGTSFVFAV